MTIFDDTHQALDSAKATLEQTLTATHDEAVPMLGSYLTTAVNNIVAAGDALDKYVASLPPAVVPLVAGLSSEGMSTPAVQVKARICNAYWRDLEPTQGAVLPAGNAIDKAIASGHPFRLRLFFGRYSPSWALALAGSVTMVDTNDPTKPITGVCPRWWHKEVQAAQAAFLARLAAKYDGLIPLVFIASPMTIFAEPMIRQVGDPTTRSNLLKAGYTPMLDRASFSAAFKMYGAFKKTRLGLAVNPLQTVTTDGKSHQDGAATCALIDEFRGAYPTGVVQNNSLRTPPLGGQYSLVYDHMTKPLAFQTATEPRVGDYGQSIEWAISKGAHLVELSPGYEKHLSPTQLASFDLRLKENTA